MFAGCPVYYTSFFAPREDHVGQASASGSPLGAGIPARSGAGACRRSLPVLAWHRQVVGQAVVPVHRPKAGRSSLRSLRTSRENKDTRQDRAHAATASPPVRCPSSSAALPAPRPKANPGLPQFRKSQTTGIITLELTSPTVTFTCILVVPVRMSIAYVPGISPARYKLRTVPEPDTVICGRSEPA